MAEDINHNIIYEETPLVANVDGMEKTEASELSIPLDRVLCFLYISHFLSRWGDRMWEFAVGLFMIAIRPDSLVLPALYGLVESASVAVFGVVVGKWVDRFPRLKVAQFSLGVQNGSIVSAASLVVILLIHVSSAPMGYKVFIMLITLVNAFGAIGALAGLAGNILVERDWVVTIADGQTPGLLAQMNSGMRHIDLTCKLLAPIAVGIIMSRVSTLASALLIAVWNIVSVCFEYWMLYSVYYATPALQLCKVNNRLPSKSHMAFEVQDDGVLVLEGLQYPANAEFPFQPLQDLDANLVQNKTTLKSFIKVVKSQVSHCLYGSKIYIYQEAVFATMSLALLYFTVLSFGTLMTAFLQMRGVPPYVLGLSRGLAALVGIGATFVYPMLQARVQTIRAGIWSIWMQVDFT